MLLSIIVPIYNTEKHLEKCLESVIAQTYKETEIILINDGSTDCSLKICKSYSECYDRIVVIDQSNKGPAVARNTGIKNAKGQFIAFVDADDYIEPEMYKELVEIALSTNADITACNFKRISTYNDFTEIKSSHIPYGTLLNKNEIKKHFLSAYYSDHHRMNIIPSLWNKVYKKSFIDNHSLMIDESRVRAEDYWFNFYALKRANSIFCINKSFYHYYDNDNSVMKIYRENQFELFLETRQELLENNKEFGFEIDYNKFNQTFIDNTNELLLLAISDGKSYEVIKKILKNNVFREVLQQTPQTRKHIQIIKALLLINWYYLVYLVYKLWSKKIKK